MPRPSRHWPLLPLLATLSACSWNHSYVHLSSEGVVLESGSNRPTYIAWYRDGELVGAAAADDPRFPYRDWVRQLEGAIEDHPQLEQWRAGIRGLRDAAASDTVSGAEVLRSAVGVPFAEPVEEGLSGWMGDRADRAAELLDQARGLEVRDPFAEQLVRIALTGTPPTALTDERLAAWHRSLAAAGHDEAALLVVAADAAGPRTARAALADLDEYHDRMRADVFRHASRHLLDDPQHADALVDAVDELPTSEEAAAANELLTSSNSPELAREVLRTLDRRSSKDRPALFAPAAALAVRDPRSHFAIAAAIGELPSSSRLEAALGVVRLSDAPRELLLLLVGRLDDLPSRDRAELVLAVLDGPHGVDAQVRSACRHATEREVPQRSRRRLLDRLDG